MPGRSLIAASVLIAASLIAASLIAGCGGDEGPAAPDFEPPADHTVRQGGAFHAPGLTDPFANCAECHGADLRGGANGEPSCLLCHGRTWE